MTIRTERLGEGPQYRDLLIADTEAELLGATPSTETAEGWARDTGIKADWVQGIGWKVGGATKGADGSFLFSSEVRSPSFADADGNPIGGGGVRKGNLTLCLGNSIGTDSYSLGSGLGTDVMCKWRGQAITLGTRLTPTYRDVRAERFYTLECTTAGTTAPGTEPKWPAIGQTIQDGTCVWTVIEDNSTFEANGARAFFMANALAGQPLEMIGYVAASGARCEYVMDCARYLLADGMDPDVVLWSGTWENDISQEPTIAQAQVNFDQYKAFNDEMLAAGRRIILSSVYPAGSYSTDILRSVAGYYAQQVGDYARLNAPQTQLFELPSLLYQSLVDGQSWQPDTAATFVVENTTSTYPRWSDGTHPGYVARYKLAKDLAQLLKNLDIPSAPLLPYTPGYQFHNNPRNLGAGPLATGWTKFASGGITANESLVVRTDGIAGNWQRIAVAQGTPATASGSVSLNYYRTLAQIGLAVGDYIDALVEIRMGALSPSVKTVSATLAFLNGTPASHTDMKHGGVSAQTLGQVIADGDIHIMRPMLRRIKIPAGTTEVRIQVTMSGFVAGAVTNWWGSFDVGRISIRKRLADKGVA